MRFRGGFTLIEVLVVTIIIGILASIAIPNYTAARERALDREAVAALRLIRAAQRQRMGELDDYWPTAAWDSDINNINGNLSLSLVSTNWVYRVRSRTSTTFDAQASRSGRTWAIRQDINDPTCTGSCL